MTESCLDLEADEAMESETDEDSMVSLYSFTVPFKPRKGVEMLTAI